MVGLSFHFSLRPADIKGLLLDEFDLYAAAIDRMAKQDD
jgi:hypothetical protein